MSGVNFTLNIPCPCHKCQIREIGCHASCYKYAEYRRILDDHLSAQAERQRIRENAFSAALIRNVHKKLKTL